MRNRIISGAGATIISMMIVLLAFAAMAAGLILTTSNKTITEACAGEFCIGQKKAEISTVLATAPEQAYENMWVSKPVNIRQVSGTGIDAVDTYDYLMIGLSGKWGREKHIRLKFKNQVLIEIDITHYGPLSVS